MGAGKVVVAVPVAPPETVARLRAEADQVVCLLVPPHFVAVGQWYENFEQTSDREVSAALREANATTGRKRGSEEEVIVRAGDVDLAGELAIPDPATGIVLFAHGSGSSRLSPRNRSMAGALGAHGFGTLLFDLLTEEEASDRRHVFDVGLLGERLLGATAWLRTRPEADRLPVGYFGASTGAAAALSAAAAPGNEVAAVVSRGGRPDLAGPRLPAVRCPTLLVVGGADTAVLGLNREAAARLRCPNHLAIVPGATHLFEEPGAMEAVAGLAIDWFASISDRRAISLTAGRVHPRAPSTEHRAPSTEHRAPRTENRAARVREDGAMIFGAHLVVFSEEADADRNFMSDVLGFDSVDAGGGWLIFASSARRDGGPSGRRFRS